MKRLTTAALFLSLMAGLWAQIPQGYYDEAKGKTGESLKTALNSIIKDHKEFEYTDKTTDVWDILKVSDRDPNSDANVILIYTGQSVNGAQEYNNRKGWSREHVWAKSHGDFDTDPPAGSDVHNLKPADISVNSARNDKDFAEGGKPHAEATECNVTTYTWEPRDEVKGDVARIMFYMATRYEGEGSEPNLELVEEVNTSGAKFGKLSDLLKWHEEDLVDDFERNRNEVIYSYQNNRNPFIDHPEYVCEIWGEDCGTTSSLEELSLLNEIKVNNPVTDEVKIQLPEEMELNIDLLSLSGQSLKKVQVANQSNVSVSVNDLNAGVYILKLSIGNEVKAIKIIKY